jgi:hypothetical protein
MFWAKAVQKMKRRVLYNELFAENRAVNGTVWENVVGFDRPQMTI